MDKKTYQKLLEAHRDRIFSYTLYSLRDQDEAEDVTQEVFLRLWKQGSEFEPEKTEAWLIRVAHNLCVDQARRRRTVRHYLGRVDEGALENLAESPEAWSNPEQSLRRTQLRQEVLNALATLSAETRSLMLMHYFQGLRLQEIAQALGKNTSTVKVQIHRARKALRLVLEGGLDNPQATKQETG